MTAASIATPPAGWRITPFGRLVNRSREEAGERDYESLSVYLDAGVVPRASRSDNYNRLGADISKYLVVRPSDLVFNKLRTWQGGFGMSRYTGVVSPAYYVCRPAESVSSRFLHYLLRSHRYLAELTRVSKWMPPSQFDILWDDLRSVPILQPPLETQYLIADFLDRETVRIDALIGAKRWLIDLLAEKRTALITHAVTKGLNPTVPMKDSGIPWIGEIPAHWTIRAISRCFRTGSGTTPRSDRMEYYGGNVPWVMSGDLNDGQVANTQKLITDEALAEYSALKRFPAGSVVIAMYGASIGTVGVTTMESTVNQACCVLEPIGPVSSSYVFNWLLANRGNLVVLGSGGGQPNISQEKVRAIRIPVPPVGEQAEIVRRLRAYGDLHDRVHNRVGRQKTVLAEYRQALITAAVTGQLDEETLTGRKPADEALGVEVPS